MNNEVSDKNTSSQMGYSKLLSRKFNSKVRRLQKACTFRQGCHILEKSWNVLVFLLSWKSPWMSFISSGKYLKILPVLCLNRIVKPLAQWAVKWDDEWIKHLLLSGRLLKLELAVSQQWCIYQISSLWWSLISSGRELKLSQRNCTLSATTPSHVTESCQPCF